MKKCRLYETWSAMRQRCLNPKSPKYKRYGGAGISICREWSDYSVYEQWALGNGYRDNLTLDRFPDNRGNYEPGNCRWATQQQQSHNRESNVNLTAFGETKCVAEWVRDPRCKVCSGTVTRRIKMGCDPETALTHRHERQCKAKITRLAKKPKSLKELRPPGRTPVVPAARMARLLEEFEFRPRGMTAKEFARQNGIDASTIYRARKRLTSATLSP